MKHFVLTVALLAAAPAFAQNTYVTGQFASVDQKVGIEDVSISDTTNGGILSLGYRVTPNFAIEGGYMSLGKFSKTDAGYNIYAKPESFYGAVVGTLAATPEFSISAKLGVARHNTKVGYNDGHGDSGETKVNKTSAMFGIGAAYNVTPKIALVAEYTHLGTLAKDDEFGESLKANVLSAGLRFNF
jgi:OOP family OmpA-OmpF porin